jgi:uncharacterized flavoprotein (TIGR03862 family)
VPLSCHDGEVPGVHRSVDVLVVGAGPAGLAASEFMLTLAPSLRVLIVDAQRSPGRKFLLAGRSGLNLTNSEPLDALCSRFSGSTAPFVERCIAAHPPGALVEWAASLGEPTFIGTSGRIFPKSMRATPILRAWLARLATLGAQLETESLVDVDSVLAGEQIRLVGAGRRAGETEIVSARSIVLALGGASWPKTGSTGAWVESFERHGVTVHRLRSSNAGALVEWSQIFRERFEGQPVKDVVVSCGAGSSQGDLVITRTGLEGGPVYSLSPVLHTTQLLTIDLRPGVPVERTIKTLERSRSGDSTGNRLRKAGLHRTSAALVMELGGRTIAHDAEALGSLVHNLRVAARVAPLDRAISSSGGVPADALNDHGMLLAKPGVFVAGEMLDWDAPTGGYLLQGCWSTGRAVGASIVDYLRDHS